MDDQERAKVVVKMLQEADFRDIIKEAIYEAGFCSKCLGQVGMRESGWQNTCWNCFESRPDGD